MTAWISRRYEALSKQAFHLAKEQVCEKSSDFMIPYSFGALHINVFTRCLSRFAGLLLTLIFGVRIFGLGNQLLQHFTHLIMGSLAA